MSATTGNDRKQEFQCALAGMAAATASIILVILATLALVWASINHGQAVAYGAGGAIIAGATGSISAAIFLIIFIGAWKWAGEPVTQMCLKRKGITPDRSRRKNYRLQRRTVAASIITGAALGTLAMAASIGALANTGTSPDNLAAIASTILGTVTGAVIGVSLAVSLIREYPY